MEKIIYQKRVYTPSGQERIIQVRENSWGGYRVIKKTNPKRGLVQTILYDSGLNFSSKAKAIKKANSLAKRY